MAVIIGLIFGVIAAIIAGSKGFKPFRWILSLGIIGFITMLFLPSARAAGITPEEARRRAAQADTVGAWMAWINVVLGIAVLVILLVINRGTMNVGLLFILIMGAIYLVAERAIAFRWLQEDTGARRKDFNPWAALTLLVPILGVGLYLLQRPHGPVATCPHCQVPSLATGYHCLHCDKPLPGPGAHDQEFLSWQLPRQAAIPLAAIAAIAITTVPTGLRYYQMLLALPAASLLMAVGGIFAFSIGACSWFLVKTQHAGQQDNPLPLLIGVTLILATAALGVVSTVMLMLTSAILALGAALAVSAILHLSLYGLGRSVAGLGIGYLIALVAYPMAANRYGLHGRSLVMASCMALFLSVVALLSARARLAAVPRTRTRISFLSVAGPLWGLLCLSLLLSYATLR